MARSDALFDLIKSLSPADKRRFRLRSLRYEAESKAYLELFDQLDSMETYDAKRLKKAFPKDTQANINLNKRYLQKALLASLYERRLLHEKSKAKSILREAEVWDEAGVTYKAARCYRKAIKVAEERGDEETRFRAMSNYYKIIPRLRQDKPSFEEFSALGTSMQESARLLEEYVTVGVGIHLLYRQFISPEKRISDKFQELFTSEVFENTADSKNGINRSYYHCVKGDYYRNQGNPELAFQHMQMAVDNYRKYPERIAELPIAYIGQLHNLLSSTQMAGRYDVMREILDELEGLPTVDQKSADKSFQARAYYGLIYASVTGTPLSEDQLKHFKEGFDRSGIDSAIIHSLRLQLGVYYFTFGEFDIAVEWINACMQDPGSERIMATYTYATLIRMLLHMEQDERNLLEYGLENWKRKRTGKMLGAEKVLVQGLQQYLKSPSSEHASIWREVEQQLEPFRKTELFQHYFDFAVWARSKWKGRSMLEELRGN